MLNFVHDLNQEEAMDLQIKFKVFAHDLRMPYNVLPPQTFERSYLDLHDLLWSFHDVYKLDNDFFEYERDVMKAYYAWQWNCFRVLKDEDPVDIEDYVENVERWFLV